MCVGVGMLCMCTVRTCITCNNKSLQPKHNYRISSKNSCLAKILEVKVQKIYAGRLKC